MTSRSFSSHARRSFRLVPYFFVVSITCLIFSSTILAQNIQHNDKGVDPGLRGAVRVNPVTRAVGFEVSLGNYPGRAGLNVPVTLSYSSKVWEVQYQGFNPGPPPGHGGIQPFTIVTANYAKHSVAGWNSSVRMPTIDSTAGQHYYNQFGAAQDQGFCVAPCYVIDRKTVWMPDGSSHELRASDQPRNVNDPLPDNFYAVDGSRLRYQASTNTLFMPDGSRYVLGTGEYFDRNGNKLTFNGSGVTDTLGHQINNPLPSFPGAGNQNFSVPGVNGTPINYVLEWRNLANALTTGTQLSFIGNSGCPPGSGGSFTPSLFSSDFGNSTCIGNSSVQFNPVVLYQIRLPNQTAYTFTYNIYGEIDKIVMPTGGYEKFQYTQVPPVSTMNFVYAQANRGISTRIISADGFGDDEVLWQYSSSGPGFTTIIAPAPGSTRSELSYWTDANSNWGYGTNGARAGSVYEERVYSSSNQMLRRKLTDWVMTGSNATGNLPATLTANRNARIARETEFVLDGDGPARAQTTVYDYDVSFQFTVGVEQTSVSHFDYFDVDQNTAQTIPITSLSTISNGTLICQITTAYLTSDANYRNRNILGLAGSVSYFNENSALVRQETYTYDESGMINVGSPPYTGWTDPATTFRGNLTTTSRWLNTTGTTLQTHTQYDQFGNIRTAVDARQQQSTIDYASAQFYAYATQATSADPDGTGPLTALVTYTEYDTATGRITAIVDANGQRTTLSYADPLNRLKQVIQASTDTTAKTQTTYDYNDATRTVTVTTDQVAFNDNLIKTATVYDAMGRLSEKRKYETVNDFITIKTEYDEVGRVSRTSNPYRGGETISWTTNVYDALSRVLTVTTPDSAVFRTDYSGDRVLVTDQAGKQRISKIDPLGRIKDVWEVTAADAATEAISFPLHSEVTAGYRTSYSYDAFDNLTKVVQGAQQRVFMYDSLGRLIRVKQPEQIVNPSLNLTDPLTSNTTWTAAYQYDANGNITQRTDARGVVSTYVYDALNRVTSVDYSDTSVNPDVSRFYDGATNGRGKFWYSYVGGNLTIGSNVEHRAIDTYDALGRPLVQRQLFKLNGVWSSPYQISRLYNRAGSVTSQAYPSGNSVSYGYDVAGRTTSLSGTLGNGVPRTYASNMTYATFGGLAREQLGTNAALYHKSFYNIRGQFFDTRLSSVDDTWDWNRGRLILYYSSNHIWGQSGTDNNGNVLFAENWIPPENATLDQASSLTEDAYAYDSLNRITSVTEQRMTAQGNWVWSQQFRQAYTYDRYGNRTIDSQLTWGGGVNAKVFTADTATNRLGVPSGQTGTMTFDNSGNLTFDTYSEVGMGTRAYDAENRMISAQDSTGATASYSYGADGQRTRRIVGGQETWYVYSFEGELLAEYPANGAAGNPRKEYGYRNGDLFVVADPAGGPVIPTFMDDFNDNSLDTVKWALTEPASPAVVSEQNQQLQITLPPSTATYNGVISQSAFNLTGKMAQVECAQTVSQAGWVENAFMVQLNASNYFLFNAGAGNLLMRSMVNGVNDQLIIPFNASVQRFWRVRHDQASNTVKFETSGNGTAWTIQKSVTPGFSLSALKFLLYAGAYGTGNATPGSAKYDNFKLLSSQAAFFSAPVVNSGFETPALGAGQFQYSPSGGTWTFANGGGISSNGSGFTSGNAVAPEGTQVAFLQGSEATITQQVSGFQAGVSYSVVFAAAQRGNCCNAGGQDFRVYIDNTLLGTFHPSSIYYYDYETATFTVPAGTHTLKFAAVNPLGGDHTAFIDNVRISGSSNGGTGIQWLITDHLGTPRMIVDETGTLANVKRHDYLPFGEELFTSSRGPGEGYGGSDGVRQQFTGKERDNETKLDFFEARYFSSTQGRFTRPDPVLSSAQVTNPQSWNRYTYTLNNPLRFIDPSGMWNWSQGLGGDLTDDQLRARQREIQDDDSLTPEEKEAEINNIDAILTARQQFRDALDLAKRIVGFSDLPPSEQSAAMAFLNMYGTENDGNGVIIAVSFAPTGAAFTREENGKVIVAITPSQLGNVNSLWGAIFHEGVHIFQSRVHTGLGMNPSLAMAEYMAYYDIASLVRGLDKRLVAAGDTQNRDYSAGQPRIFLYQRGFSDVDIKNGVESHLQRLGLLDSQKNETPKGAAPTFPGGGKGQWQ